MKIYKTQKEVEKDIKDRVLTIEGDVKFECSISISASIKVIAGDINAWDINAGNINAGNINAGNINAGNINAGDINAGDIDAGDINAGDINAWDIDARDINAWDIDAWDINAWDINARDINARDIVYNAFCCVYKSIKCFSWKAKREKYQEPICLDGKLEIKTKENEEDNDVLNAIKLREMKRW
jgi:hypothetical protein